MIQPLVFRIQSSNCIFSVWIILISTCPHTGILKELVYSGWWESLLVRLFTQWFHEYTRSCHFVQRCAEYLVHDSFSVKFISWQETKWVNCWKKKLAFGKPTYFKVYNNNQVPNTLNKQINNFLRKYVKQLCFRSGIHRY